MVLVNYEEESERALLWALPMLLLSTVAGVDLEIYENYTNYFLYVHTRAKGGCLSIDSVKYFMKED